MGTWFAAIFSDDNASDLLDDYRDLIGAGVAGPEATDRRIGRPTPRTRTMPRRSGSRLPSRSGDAAAWTSASGAAP
jgi:hypothetical protein